MKNRVKILKFYHFMNKNARVASFRNSVYFPELRHFRFSSPTGRMEMKPSMKKTVYFPMINESSITFLVTKLVLNHQIIITQWNLALKSVRFREVFVLWRSFYIKIACLGQKKSPSWRGARLEGCPSWGGFTVLYIGERDSISNLFLILSKQIWKFEN